MSDDDERSFSQPFPTFASQETALPTGPAFQPAGGSFGSVSGAPTFGGPTQQSASSSRPSSQSISRVAQPVSSAQPAAQSAFAAPQARAPVGGTNAAGAHGRAIPDPARAQLTAGATRRSGPAHVQPAASATRSSGPAASQPASDPARSQPTAADSALDAATTAACTATLSAFRQGRLTRADAIGQFTDHIARANGPPQAVAPWLEAMCQHFFSAVLAKAAGSARLPAAPVAQPVPASLQSAPPVLAHVDPVQRARPAPPALSGRSSPSSSDDDNDRGIADDAPTGSRKRPAYDPDAAPFRSAEARLAARLVSAHVARTLSIRANYCADLRAAKQDILRDGLAPPLPEDLWESVLANRVVDFDKILSARSAPQVPERQSQQIGDADAYIVLGSARATRKVANRSQWQECWNIYAEAVVYAYPHRKHELQSYSRLVNDLFDSIHDSHHSVVLRGEIAMRSDVAANRTWSFFDDDKLTR